MTLTEQGPVLSGVPEGVTVLRWGRPDAGEFLLGQGGTLSTAKHFEGVVVCLKPGYDVLYDPTVDGFTVHRLPKTVPFELRAVFIVRNLMDWDRIQKLSGSLKVKFEDIA